MQAHDGEIIVVLEMPERDILLTASYGSNRIKAWSISNSFSLVQEIYLDGHKDSVTCLCQVDNYLMSGCNRGTLVVWSLQ